MSGDFLVEKCGGILCDVLRNKKNNKPMQSLTTVKARFKRVLKSEDFSKIEKREELRKIANMFLKHNQLGSAQTALNELKKLN